MTNSEALAILEEEQGIGFSLVMIENVTIVDISSYIHVRDVEGWTIAQTARQSESQFSQFLCIVVSQ